MQTVDHPERKHKTKGCCEPATRLRRKLIDLLSELADKRSDERSRWHCASERPLLSLYIVGNYVAENSHGRSKPGTQTRDKDESEISRKEQNKRRKKLEHTKRPRKNDDADTSFFARNTAKIVNQTNLPPSHERYKLIYLYSTFRTPIYIDGGKKNKNNKDLSSLFVILCIIQRRDPRLCKETSVPEHCER